MSAAISERGGVLGAMDTMYERGKIREESMYYAEQHQVGKKHDGSLPLVGVNTFLPKEHGGAIVTQIELIRSTEQEKSQQITNVATYQHLRNAAALASAVALPPSPPGRGTEGEGTSPPGPSENQLSYLQQTARDRQNVFAALMEAVKTHSLGQISHALYDVGGEYRRNM